MSLFNDWRWQIKNSIKTVDGLRLLSKSESRNLWLEQNFGQAALPFSVTPYFASLMGEDEHCPLFLQVVASEQEIKSDQSDRRDPLGEEEREKVKNLIMTRYSGDLEI